MTTDETKCARCGYPAKEHHHDGACYGLCGKFVPIHMEPALAGTPEDIAAMGWVTYKEHCEIIASITGKDDQLSRIENKLNMVITALGLNQLTKRTDDEPAKT